MVYLSFVFVSDFSFGDFGKGLYFSKFPSKAAQFSAVSRSFFFTFSFLEIPSVG